MKDPLYVLDGYGLIYRAYFGFINRPLLDSQGRNISGLYGFFRTLLTLKQRFHPSLLAVALDPPTPTFRHIRYPAYKAHRDAAPEDLHAQVPFIKEILELWEVPVLLAEGFEADDIMGTLAFQCREEERPCYLVSADKDLMQLVGDGVFLLRPGKGGDFQQIGPQEVLEEKGVLPTQIVDYLALVGDASDNVPGVLGIGEKTAAALLKEWESLEGIYASLDEALKGSRRDKMIAGRKNALLSQELVALRKDVNLGAAPENLRAFQGDVTGVAKLLRERELPSLAREIDGKEGLPLPGKEGALAGEYHAILTPEDLQRWGQKIRESGVVAMDTETDALDPLQARLVGISFAVKPREAAYLPLVAPEGACLPQETVVSWLKELFEKGDIKIIGQNFKYDRKVLAQIGVKTEGPWFDTMVAAWMLDAEGQVGMDSLAERYLNYHTTHFADVVPKGTSFAQVPLEQAVSYAAEDADITFRLYQKFLPALEKDPERYKVFREMEMPLISVLVDMECRGIFLDKSVLREFHEELKTGIEKLEQEIYALCGREFNIGSPKQLQEILFEERKLKPVKKTKTGWSTNNTVLLDLAKVDPVPDKVLQYRSLTKLKSTYVDALPKMVNPHTRRVHTNYAQTGAATGRLASKDPNLQNIPIRDENGRRIRRAFHPAEGCTFVSADYSQIELVVLAHMSGDEGLIEAFQEGQDVHRRTASLLFGVEAEQVSPEQRRLAKAVNFGVMYGMSAFRLSNELQISRKDAKVFIESYFETYRGIKSFIDSTITAAEAAGGVRTLYGRYRPISGIRSRNKVEKSGAERAAVNTRIQGTAADIMKMAMLRVWRRLGSQGLGAQMLLQVHDELLLEVPLGEVPQVKSLLKEEMSLAAELVVPLMVNVETGSTWGDIH